MALKSWQTLLLRGLVPFVLVLFAASLRVWPLQDLDLRLAYLTFYPVVTIAAFYGGASSALLATLLSSLVVIFWRPSGLSFVQDAADWLGVAVFVFNGMMVAAISGVMHHHKSCLYEELLERERSECTLRQNDARFRATFEQAAVGIAHVGTDGRWLRVNDKLCRIVGYSADALMEKTFQDITHPDDLDVDLGYVHQMLAGEISTYTMDKRYFHRDGQTVWVRLTVSLMRDEHARPDYFISVVEDITESKHAAEELKKLRAETTLLLEEQVMIQTLLALAHELNQPLNASASYSEAALRLMGKEALQLDKVEEVIRLNVSEIQRAGTVLRDLMHVAEKNKQTLELLDLNDTLAAGIRLFESEQVESQTLLKFEPLYQDGKISANPFTIEKVLLSLLTNAQLATAAATYPVITVRSVNHENGALVSVIDNGSTMPKEIIAKLFEPFFTTRSNGIGMGLVISRALIENDNGKLWFEPVDGKTAFHFTLQSTEHRAQSTEHRAQSTEHRAQSTEHRAISYYPLK